MRRWMKTLRQSWITIWSFFKQIKQKTADERTAVALLQEISKDRRMEEMREEREAKNNILATEKQKKFMENLGIKYPKAL